MVVKKENKKKSPGKKGRSTAKSGKPSARKKKRSTGKKGKITRRLLSYLALILLSLALLVLFLAGLVHMGVFGRLPGEESLAQIRHYTSTRVMSSDGEVLGMYYIENRTNEKIEDIPASFIDALIATEDVRFFHHNGIDTRSLLRVFFKSVLLFDRDAGGGSTITQQLAKNLFPRKNYGFLTLPVAKMKEAIIARRLERAYTKEEILELYINTVSFGENTYGIATASMTFFNKPPSRLKTEESALLTGLLKANSSYNPRTHPEAALQRRNIVLSQMEKYGYLTTDEADSLAALPIMLDYRKIDHVEGLAPYFREQIRHQAADILEEINRERGTHYNLYTDGLTIITTLDSRLQAYAEMSVKEHLTRLQDQFDEHWSRGRPWEDDLKVAELAIRQSEPYQQYRKMGLSNEEAIDSMRSVKRECAIYLGGHHVDTLISPLDSVLHHLGVLQAGMLVMDPGNGDILAWVGGTDYRFFKYDHVTASRQIGSTFKPIVYASAFEQGLDPCRFFENDSVTYEAYDDWTPSNADNTYGGYYSVKGALVNSVNTVSVKVLFEAGIDHVIEQAEKMGIGSDLPEVPSLALGTAGIPLLEMTNAYCSFANGGMYVSPRSIQKILDQEGNTVYESAVPEVERVLSASTADPIVSILEDVADRGTARSLRERWNIRGEVAGKTGTTQNQADGWFIGMVPGLVAGVWVGGEVPAVRFRTIALGQGSTMALPVFARFVNDLHGDRYYRRIAGESFKLSDSADALDCEDYKEDIRFDFLDIFKKKEVTEKRPERIHKMEDKSEEGTRVGNFLRKIFGEKKDKDK